MSDLRIGQRVRVRAGMHAGAVRAGVEALLAEVTARLDQLSTCWSEGYPRKQPHLDERSQELIAELSEVAESLRVILAGGER